MLSNRCIFRDENVSLRLYVLFLCNPMSGILP
jgi:hypothetical protein